ncbi:hypothetical protein DM02DRAFT_656799 [Periconia macrospinosa]|uniref:Uncharacterized protein n=1 Tax=Periconia macrospinosa TaxID=97972 RepID=A0A2V1DLE8_9PLEO|nr:hypothetical protein DM02DRAFT_656799 [Periconia macrospinosa]
MVRQTTFPGTQHIGSAAQFSHWRRYNVFYGLLLTTTLSSVLLAADQFKWRATGISFRLANQYPASVAFLVQILAALFGVMHVAVITKLLNYALRLRLTRVSVTLDVMRTWVDLSIPRMDWDLPIRFLIPVMFMVLLSLVPAALWAGSITPLIDQTTGTGTILIPSYDDVSMIKEYPMEIGQAGPSLRNRRGLFTYCPGQQLIGPLLSSAASASSIGMMKQVHPKIDNTQFSYTGRSYGVGATVGLLDRNITADYQAAGYFYEEQGYFANVSCIYNQTTDFLLSGPVSEWIYTAGGNLPDSEGGPEYSNYIGHDGKAIVAMGVAWSEQSPRRYISITAGEAYRALNSTQCEIDFQPMLFNVTVDLANLNITVASTGPAPDFNPQRNLTRTVVRQFELLSNDLTNLYVSLLGEAFNSSIASFNMTRSMASKDPLSEEDATLAGLSNSITAMADDLLLAYGSAQLMVGRKSVPKSAIVYRYGLQFGQPAYIYSIFALNLLIILAVLGEAVRTHAWNDLPRFNYLDPRDLVVAASRGGTGLATAADDMANSDAPSTTKAHKRVWLLSDPDEGNGQLVVRMGPDDHGHAAIKVVDAGVGGRLRNLSLAMPAMFNELPKSPLGPGFVDDPHLIDAEKARALSVWEEKRRREGEKGRGRRIGIWGEKG